MSWQFLRICSVSSLAWTNLDVVSLSLSLVSCTEIYKHLFYKLHFTSKKRFCCVTMNCSEDVQSKLHINFTGCFCGLEQLTLFFSLFIVNFAGRQLKVKALFWERLSEIAMLMMTSLQDHYCTISTPFHFSHLCRIWQMKRK